MHWNVRRPSPPGGSARTKYAPQWGQVGRSACPIMAILRPSSYRRLSDPRLIKIEIGHYGKQTRPLALETGHYPPPVEDGTRNENSLRKWQCACWISSGQPLAGHVLRSWAHPPAYDPVDLDAVERAMLEQAGSEAIIKPTAPAFRTKSAAGPACGY